jgi:hypothetical protein
MKEHLNAHLSHDLEGHVPSDWLARHNKGRCRGCGLIVAASRQLCSNPDCRAADRAAQPPPPQVIGPSVPAPSVASNMPDLDEVFTARRLTFRHIPHRARRKWAQVLIRCLAMVVVHNSVAAWTELLMLPKCSLCTPPAKGPKAHKRTSAAYTLDRLARWEAGERASLWANYNEANGNPKVSNSVEARHTRAITLCREGLYGKGCSALSSGGLAKSCQGAITKLRDLHPFAAPLDRTPSQNLSLAPAMSLDLVARRLRSFPWHCSWALRPSCSTFG